MVCSVKSLDEIDKDTPCVFIVLFSRLEDALEGEGSVSTADIGGTAELVSGASFV